ncbi:MAG: pyrophosphokinae family protein [Bacillales bacterium]|jgi:putative GTP pyrophosphokinase|nr:pyrophosphokinae family protein [Bacillales bacterium]
MHNWESFLLPYKQAVEELKLKLRGIRASYELDKLHSPIEFVTGRVKPIKSIQTKLIDLLATEDEIESVVKDIAGLRIMCQFVEDIDTIVKHLRVRSDLQVIEERDYVSNKKESGYRSYHLVVKYPVQTHKGKKHIYAEIQIRTLAMNFWASIEHSLNYKFEGSIPAPIQWRLENLAEQVSKLDEEMTRIRQDIHEAQKSVFKGL